MMIGSNIEKALVKRLDFTRNLARRVGLEALEFRLQRGIGGTGYIKQGLAGFCK